MKIILKNQEAEKQPTFGDVKPSQFFVSAGGTLCQKKDERSYNRIARASGFPDADSGTMNEDTDIERILPEVERIEF